MKRQIISMMLTLLLAVSLSACGSYGNPAYTDQNNQANGRTGTTTDSDNGIIGNNGMDMLPDTRDGYVDDDNADDGYVEGDRTDNGNSMNGSGLNGNTSSGMNGSSGNGMNGNSGNGNSAGSDIGGNTTSPNPSVSARP